MLNESCTIVMKRFVDEPSLLIWRELRSPFGAEPWGTDLVLAWFCDTVN